MFGRTARLTTKGQVTIPADVRRLLGVGQHDQVTFLVEAGEVRLTASAVSVVARTAGVLKDSQPRLSAREEKLIASSAMVAEHS